MAATFAFTPDQALDLNLSDLTFWRDRALHYRIQFPPPWLT